MSPDDTTLLERWTTQHDAEAFNAIVDRFADQVYATCRRILRNDADAEDVAQECFLHLVRAGGDVRASLGGWLHRAATSKSLDRIRRDASRRAREGAYADVADATGVPVDAGWDEIQRHVDEAIEALPEETRDAIVAHFLGRKSHAEIAKDFGVSRRAVSYRIERGVAAIRRELSRRGVSLSAAALVPLLAMEAAAAPLSLKASLGRLALAAGTNSGGGGVTAGGSLLGSLVLMNAKSIVVSVVLCLIGAGIYVVTAGNRNTAGTATLEVAGAPVVPETRSAPSGPRDSGVKAGDDSVEDAPAKPPSMEELLALSRAEAGRGLENYPRIEDPAAFASISGTVLDQDAYPVAGTAIQVIPGDNWGVLPGIGGMSYTASSGSDGAYQIAGIARAGRYYVFASKPGFANASWGKGMQSSLTVEPGMEATGVDLVLQSGVSVSGRVLSAKGEPVPDAVVHCVSIDSSAFSGLGFFGNRTDSAGNFTLGFDAKHRGGTATLRVASDRHGSGKFTGIAIEDTEGLALRIAASSIIHGTARFGDGSPVSKARLSFSGGRPDAANSFLGFVAVVPCDHEGRYAVEVDSGLDYTVAAEGSRSHIDPEGRWVRALEPGETREHNVVFDSDVITIRGRIIGQPSGQPIADSAMVWIVVKRERDGETVANLHCSANQPYEVLFSDDAGTYTLQARHSPEDYVTGPVSPPIALAPGDEVELDLEIPEPQVFSARAIDIHGAPLEGVSIQLVGKMGSLAPDMRSDGTGRFERSLSMAPESDAYIELSKPGYATARGPVYEDQSPGNVHPEETIVLWPGAGFEGDLVDVDGRPVVDTALVVSVTNGDGETWSLPARTDANGHFTVVDQAPADAVDIAIRTHDGPGAWEAGQLQLESNAITNLGAISLE